MEVILDCFFEQYFAELERSSLLSRSKRRQLVDYFNTVITGCSAGEECDPESACRRAVIAAIGYHKQHKDSNGTICLMGKYHNVLYLAVKICFDWNLRDTELVSQLLGEIYHCEKTFERIFVGAIFGPTAPHFIAGWKSDFKDREENVKALTYFLHHATNSELQFSEGIRFIDVPMESCGHATPLRVVIQVGAPDVLLILLRFGATVSSEKISTSSIETILDRLKEYETGRVYPFTLVACLKFILRAIPMIRIPAQVLLSDYNDKKYKNTCDNSQILLDKYNCLIEDAIIPESRCGIKPPELKHLARCIIRERLRDNYKLPYGIQDLHISENMRAYIDLQVD